MIERLRGCSSLQRIRETPAERLILGPSMHLAVEGCHEMITKPFGSLSSPSTEPFRLQ